MQVGLTEAAELTGKNPSTLTRAVNAGKLSAVSAPDGTRQFMVAELERWAGKLRTPGEERTDAPEVQRTELHDALEEARAAQIEGYREQIRLLEGVLDETRKDRDRWQEQAGQITRLLTDQRAETERERDRREAAERLTAAAAPAGGQGGAARSGLFARLFRSRRSAEGRPSA